MSTGATKKDAQQHTVLLTLKETARRLSWSVGHTRRLVASRELASVKIGGRAVRIAEADLEAFLERRRRAAR